MNEAIEHPQLDEAEQNVEIIVGRLTKAMKKCILALTGEWSDRGYSKVAADLLWATDVKFYPERFGPLVDCRYHFSEGSSPRYQHKLLPLGLEVKAYLESHHDGGN